MLDPIQVEVYGANMPLNQVATVSVPEPRMLSVQVWDRSNVQPVEKAIRSSGLGLNPITDGQMIRLPIPDLTEERRKELAKLRRPICGEGEDRGPQRSPRRMEHLKADEKKHEISEDERKRLETEVQKLTDETIKEIDDRRGDQGKGNPRQVSPAAAPTKEKRPAEGGSVPRHVAIIMDGNGRWAKQRGLPRVAGHRAGAEAVRQTLRAAVKHGVEVLTLYAFSSENWRRPEEEVSDLKGLLGFYLERELDSLAKEGVRLRLIGDYSKFGPDLSARLERAMTQLEANARLTLVVALELRIAR